MALSTGLRPLCVFVNYGQKHVIEYSAAKALADKLKVMLTVLDFSAFGEVSKSNLTTPGNKIQYEGVNFHNVPCRNTFLLSIATAIAESEGIPLVWYGADFSDRLNLFPDCYQEYVMKMNELFSATTSTKVRVEAPLLGLTKEMVKELLKNVFGIGSEEIHSGY